jgi:hypothetical protein
VRRHAEELLPAYSLGREDADDGTVARGLEVSGSPIPGHFEKVIDELTRERLRLDFHLCVATQLLCVGV